MPKVHCAYLCTKENVLNTLSIECILYFCTCGYIDVFSELMTQPQQATTLQSLHTATTIRICTCNLKYKVESIHMTDNIYQKYLYRMNLFLKTTSVFPEGSSSLTRWIVLKRNAYRSLCPCQYSLQQSLPCDN